ncbi:restriction endonuclease PLD domain-containing protein [Helicovermis profundi]|uniref:Restriction endonuclease type II NgoFVII N-terminal domain-containing protein n=1 Tax=Helicovermis profundi TaxID=3065157 RepID=A0AAU9E1Q2_9FIRM|nr:hypothetical protein HLPR_07200 [Clostridia bacterium S502]
MKLIDNISTNHNICIQSMLTSADHLVLVSPLLTESFDEFIHGISIIDVSKITLIITLKDNSPDLFKKVNTLHSFCISCMQNSVDFEIRVDNALHGKLYIALKKNQPIAGIITSANFTVRGLSMNHEWGIEITDTHTHMMDKALNDLYTVSSKPLSKLELDSIIRDIDDYMKVNPQEKENKPKLNITKHFKDKFTAHSKGSLDLSSDVRYFIKPIGWTDKLFEENRILDAGIMEMHFSKRKPSTVRNGDILVCYGVGSTKLLGYFWVVSDLYYDDSDSTRWPWRVKAENLSPIYSQIWASKDYTLSMLGSYTEKVRV